MTSTTLTALWTPVEIQYIKSHLLKNVGAVC